MFPLKKPEHIANAIMKHWKSQTHSKHYHEALKKPEHIANTIMKHWKAVHRSVDQFLTSNVGEFLCEALNIRLQTIWAKSPCSKGIVERQLKDNRWKTIERQSLKDNLALSEMLNKVL